MSQTALHPWLASPQARIGAYNGVETALSFGDPARELTQLRSGCGVFALDWRTKITATGKDRVRWLHNMVTNNIRDLAANHGNYNFVLNAQGRILGDMYVFNRGEYLLLDTDSIQVEALLNTMKRFIIMDKVELTSSADATIALGVCGPKAEEVLAAAGINAGGLEPLELCDITLDGDDVGAPSRAAAGAEPSHPESKLSGGGERSDMIVKGPQQKPGWYEIWLDPANAQKIWEMLVNAGAQPVGAEALEMWRVLRGIPRCGQDIRDRDLPQETEQTQALNFTKGCYIGQEIVERIRSRGQVHRKFTGLEFTGGLPALGKYESEGRTVAEVTTALLVPTPAGEKNIGLGYVRRESAAAGHDVDLNGNKARLVDLPFEI